MKVVKVVIETPRGSALKYHYDRATKLLTLKKILPLGMMFPYDFGFIPDTKGEDGDPLDVLVISEFDIFPGCLMECRIIGGFKAEQSEEKKPQKTIRNDRFFAIPILSTIFQDVISLKDLPEESVKEIEKFFIQYNKIQGKSFKVLEKLSPKKAMSLIF